MQISVRSLDSVIAEFNLEPPTLLKIDVEGAEVELLQNFTRYLSSVRVAFIETHSGKNHEFVRGWLAENEFQILEETWDEGRGLGRFWGERK